MLKINLQNQEFFNNETQTFEVCEAIELHLEHSLLAVSKWESRYETAFLGSDKKSVEQIEFYIECMILNEKYDRKVIKYLTAEDLQSIHNYINSSQSATTFMEQTQKRGPSEVVTSELIYYWMTAFNIPFECETWHLNRLLNLIKIANIKNSKPKRISKNEMASRYRDLNKQRREQLGTTG